jgi:hypothetical protein
MLGLALLAAPQFLRSAFELIGAGPVPTTVAERDDYLDKRFGTYPFYRRLNAERGFHYVVYAFHDEPMKYYCQGRQLGDWFGRDRYAGIDLTTGAKLFRSLRNLGADYLLVNARDVPTPLPHDESFREHFVPVFERPGITAFELRGDLFRAVVPAHP